MEECSKRWDASYLLVNIKIIPPQFIRAFMLLQIAMTCNLLWKQTILGISFLLVTLRHYAFRLAMCSCEQPPVHFAVR
jgi:hypothetical protein